MTTPIFNTTVHFPKPPSPQSSPSSQPPVPLPPPIEEILVVSPSPDPPPPYRAPRRSRGTTSRSIRRAVQASDDSYTSVGGVSLQGDVDNEGATEATPLIRRRTLSHSSTAAPSVHSIAQTVLSSSRTMMSLFQTEEDRPVAEASSVERSFAKRTKRYFRPFFKRTYYAALFHLLVINLPFEIAAWVYLFVGTLVCFQHRSLVTPCSLILF